MDPFSEINGVKSIRDFLTAEYLVWTYWMRFTRSINKRRLNTCSAAGTSTVLLEASQMQSRTALMCSAASEPWKSQALSTPSTNSWSLSGSARGKLTKEDSTAGPKSCQMCVIPGGFIQQCAWWRSKTGSINKPLKTSSSTARINKEGSAIDQATPWTYSIPFLASLLFLCCSQKSMV